MDFSGVQKSCFAAFARAITVTRQGGSPTAARGIFNSSHQGVDPNTGAVVLIDKPVVDVILSEMPGGDLKRGDAVDVGGTAYSVSEVRDDGEGVASAILLLA